MRCAVGDLAVITRFGGTDPDYGAFWECMPQTSLRAWLKGYGDWPDDIKEEVMILDTQLRPIRNPPGTDETLVRKDRHEPMSEQDYVRALRTAQSLTVGTP